MGCCQSRNHNLAYNTESTAKALDSFDSLESYEFLPKGNKNKGSPQFSPTKEPIRDKNVEGLKMLDDAEEDFPEVSDIPSLTFEENQTFNKSKSSGNIASLNSVQEKIAMSDARTLKTSNKKITCSSRTNLGFEKRAVFIEEKNLLNISAISEFVESEDEQPSYIHSNSDVIVSRESTRSLRKKGSDSILNTSSTAIESQIPAELYQITFNKNSDMHDSVRSRERYFSIAECKGGNLENYYSNYGTGSINRGNNSNMISSIFQKHRYLIFYFEFNYFNLMKWAKEYIQSVYPETNLIVTLELDDNRATQQKIVLIRSDEKNKYLPMLKSNDLLKKTGHRSIKFLSIPIDDNEVHKLKILIGTYSNDMLTIISKEEIFVNTYVEFEMHRHVLYQNIFSINNSKKIGNAYMTFMYKIDDLNTIVTNENLDDLTNQYLNNFSSSFLLRTYQENPESVYTYYAIDNFSITGKKLANENKGEEVENYFTITNIKVRDYNENDNLDQILELLITADSTYDLLNILKKINNFFSKKEFDEERLLKCKTNLMVVLEKISKSKTYDWILMLCINDTFKKTFFKQTKTTNQPKQKKSENDDFMKDPENMKKNIELLVNFVKTSVDILTNDFERISDEIIISIVSLIHKVIEESINVPIDKGGKKTSDDLFMEYLISSESIPILCNCLIRHKDDYNCVYAITGILTKIIKMKRDKSKQPLIENFIKPQFLDTLHFIIENNKCNSIVINNLLLMLNLGVEYLDFENIFRVMSIELLEQIFCIFKINGFDIVHETSINLIKSIFTKKRAAEFLRPKDYQSFVSISANAFIFLRNKVIMQDLMRLGKNMFNLMNTLFNVVNLLYNSTDKELVFKLSFEQGLLELLSEALLIMMEKQVFRRIENCFQDKLDFSLINTKTIILRTLFYCMSLVSSIYQYYEKSLTRTVCEKFYRVLKNIDENDTVYNPAETQKIIERFINQHTYARNLMDLWKELKRYYDRYKEKVVEFAPSIVAILKKT